MHDIIEKILSDAVYAPSGDNSQPWEFGIKNSAIEIFNLPHRDNEVFNFEQAGSYIAHGALIENINILASRYGLRANVAVFPDNFNSNHTATVFLVQQQNIPTDPLAEHVKQRCTNRKKYFSTPLSTDEKKTLFDSTDKLGFGRLIIQENLEKKEILGAACSTAEKVMLQYKPLHKAFFNLVTWNEAEQDKKRMGMYIKTLELLPPQKAVFRLLSHWTLARLLSLLQFPKIVAKENAKIYATSPAIAAIVMQNDNSISFINTGRLLQRIWLTATALGLFMQPLAGVLYLKRRLQKAGLKGLDENLKQEIIKSASKIHSCFSNPDGAITMMFRIGKADPPSATSSKLAPAIII